MWYDIVSPFRAQSASSNLAHEQVHLLQLIVSSCVMVYHAARQPGAPCDIMKFYIYVILKRMLDWRLRHLFWTCPHVNVAGLHWWSVNVGSGNVDPDLCRHLVSLGHNEFIQVLLKNSWVLLPLCIWLWQELMLKFLFATWDAHIAANVFTHIYAINFYFLAWIRD